MNSAHTHTLEELKQLLLSNNRELRFQAYTILLLDTISLYVYNDRVIVVGG